MIVSLFVEFFFRSQINWMTSTARADTPKKYEISSYRNRIVKLNFCSLSLLLPQKKITIKRNIFHTHIPTYVKHLIFSSISCCFFCLNVILFFCSSSEESIYFPWHIVCNNTWMLPHANHKAMLHISQAHFIRRLNSSA